MPSRHLGRLLDHVHLRVADLEASRRSDRAALRALGRELMADEPDHFASNELFVDRADGPASPIFAFPHEPVPFSVVVDVIADQ